MNYTAVIIGSLLRACLVAVFASALAGPVARLYWSQRRAIVRRLLVALLVTTAIAPSVLTAYTYSNFSLSLIRHPWANESFYALLLAMKWFPLGVGILCLSPPAPVSATAWHLLRRCPPGRCNMLTRCRLWLFHGPGRGRFLAALAVFAFALHDFEMASLFVRPAWTVWLFDAQVGGMPVGQLLMRAAVPGAMGLSALGVIWSTLGSNQPDMLREQEIADASPAHAAAGWAIVIVSAVATWIIPAVVVIREAAGSTGPPAEMPDPVAPIGSSIIFAAAATVVAIVAAARSRQLSRLMWIVCLIGLSGSLVLALVIQTIFQSGPLSGLYDTPIPLLLALALWLTPLGLILKSVLDRRSLTPALHTARLLGRSRDAAQRRNAGALAWSLRGRRWTLMIGLLFILGYFEIVAGAMLAPSGITTAPVRLYNLMHYGHTGPLSFMLLLTMAAAAAVLICGYILFKLVHERAIAANNTVASGGRGAGPTRPPAAGSDHA